MLTVQLYSHSVHPKLKAFRELLLTYNEPEEENEEEADDSIGEEGLSVGRVEKSLICPFTQARFVEPVKNKNCGHTYSNEGIFGHILEVVIPRLHWQVRTVLSILKLFSNAVPFWK